MDWSKKWLVDFNAWKTQLVSFDQSNNNDSIDVRMDRSVFEEKSSSKMPGGFDNKPQEYIYCYNEIYNLFNESLFAISKFLKVIKYAE